VDAADAAISSAMDAATKQGGGAPITNNAAAADAGGIYFALGSKSSPFDPITTLQR
jgi:hypothetical protein